MKRVLIWGTEKCYDKYLNALKYQELLGSINVVGVTSEYYSYEYVDGWPFVKSKDIYSLGFDVLVIAAEKEEDRFKKINDEAQKRGIKEENIIPMKVFAIPGFNIDKYLNLKSGGGISIMACNCWGGMTYHSLELPFLTPLINVFENEWEYIKIMENLHYYMNQKITFAYQHKDGTSGTEWPVGHLGDVLIHFRHAKSFEEGLQDWERRKGRINYDNIFAMMYTENIQVAERFDKLPYERKVCFFPFNSELPSVHSLKMVNKEKNLWDIINGLGENNIKEYDVLELLSGIDNYTRISDK